MAEDPSPSRGKRRRPTVSRAERDYESWRLRRLAARAPLYTDVCEPGLLSFLTTVWNTPAKYLRILADSLFEQAGRHAFEWVVLDNGSSDEETRACLTELVARHPFVRYHRIHDNLGIIGGMRYVLDRATGRYVLPLDSDDYLYPDTLSILAHFIHGHGYPPILYSDEDKIHEDRFLEPSFKPDWDPVLFLNSCYIAHLGAFDRLLAKELGVYSDPSAEGCHDWETFIRFMLAGHRPVHVDEIVYGWRMHDASCALNILSKDFITRSHAAVLSRYLSRLARPDHFELHYSRLFMSAYDWWFRRKPVDPVPLLTLVLTERETGDGPDRIRHATDYPQNRIVAVPRRSTPGEIASVIRRHPGASMVALVHESVKIDDPQWPWEALGVMEAHPDTAVVGGMILNSRKEFVEAGRYFGCGGACGCPERGLDATPPFSHARAYKRHSVSAVSSRFLVADAAFLEDFFRHGCPPDASLEWLGAWAGAHARRKGQRVVYTPEIPARSDGDWEERVTPREVQAFLAAHADMIPDSRFYSRFLSLAPGREYVPARPRPREPRYLDESPGASRVLSQRAVEDPPIPLPTSRTEGTRGRLEGLFDPDYYAASNADVALSGKDPLEHFLAAGAREGRKPNPLFDPEYYLDNNPEVEASGANPLVHFAEKGAWEGRKPNPLFDPAYYLEKYPDVARSGRNPLAHFLERGAAQGRRPNPLFDTAFYLACYSGAMTRGWNPLAHFLEVGATGGHRPNPLFHPEYYLSQCEGEPDRGGNPLVHFLETGARRGFKPNPLFDPSYYLQENPDVAGAGVNPLVHYLAEGASEGRKPIPLFDTAWYLSQNPDVAASGWNPLAHYLEKGAAEGRKPNAGADSGYYVPREGFSILPIEQERALELLSLPDVEIVERDDPPEVCLLLPKLQASSFSGGPNTAFVLCGELAKRGVPIHAISIDFPADPVEVLRKHVAKLIGDEEAAERFRVSSGVKGKPVRIGRRDVFLATCWWSAHRAAELLPRMKRKNFVYLIQDFEPLFYAWGHHQALALGTYSHDFLPVINERLLAEFFCRFGPGRFADPEFCRKALVFEPAVERACFHPTKNGPASGAKRRILFYSRPSAPRNLFEMGVEALQDLVRRGVIDPETWEVQLMGDHLPPVDLGRGMLGMSLRWMDFESYCEKVRGASVGLSLMLSPHTSYPPLEMAASGLDVVTTAYGCKTAERLRAISSNIIPVEPSVSDIVRGLERAVRRAVSRKGRASGEIAMPATWAESLESVIGPVLEFLGPEFVRATRPRVEDRADSYPAWLDRRIAERGRALRAPGRPGLFSLLTCIYEKTPPGFFREAAESVLAQTSRDFEWVVLAHGPTTPELDCVVDEIAADPRVRVVRLPENLGIQGGMKVCLDQATGEYVAPLDADDLITQDALEVLAQAIEDHGAPPLLYSDEDFLIDGRPTAPYLRPDWDPLLNVATSYVWHLCAFRRDRALELGVYQDPGSHFCHDWDTLSRFARAGLTPVHVPEVLYHWRRHEASHTNQEGVDKASLKRSLESQRHVQELLVATLERPELFAIKPFPIFRGAPEWWIERKRTAPEPLHAILMARSTEKAAVALKSVAHDARYPFASLQAVGVPEIPRNARDEIQALLRGAQKSAVSAASGGNPVGSIAATGLRGLAEAVDSLGDDLVAVFAEGIQPLQDGWPWEALVIGALVPDAAFVAGRILSADGVVAGGPEAFGFGGLVGCPDRGRVAAEPGYYCILLKARSVDAPNGAFFVARASRLREALASLPAAATPGFLGAWLGAWAAERGLRVGYSPLMAARAAVGFDPSMTPGPGEGEAFTEKYLAVLAHPRWYSAILSRAPGQGWEPDLRPPGRSAEIAEALRKMVETRQDVPAASGTRLAPLELRTP